MSRDAVLNACKEALEQPAEPRLVSYALDCSTCTLNIDGEEVYFNREQPAQEPVAWGMERMGMILDCIHPEEHAREEGEYTIPLYTHPHQWQGLTDDEIADLFAKVATNQIGWLEFARAIEQALKEKNHVGST